MILFALLITQTYTSYDPRIPIVPPAEMRDVALFEERLGISIGTGAELMSQCPWVSDNNRSGSYCVRHLGGIDGRVDRYTEDLVAAGWRFQVGTVDGDRPINDLCRNGQWLQVSSYLAPGSFYTSIATMFEKHEEAALYLLDSLPIAFTFKGLDKECPQ